MSFKEKLIAGFAPEEILIHETLGRKSNDLLTLLTSAIKYHYDFIQDKSEDRTVLYLKKK